MAFKNIADQTNGFYIPCVSLFGPGCAKEIGGKAQNLGAKKALIVTDAGLFKFGVADTIAGYLKDAGVDSHIFPGAEPNPTDINVHNGVTAYNEQGCDFIVSLGGGSSHDCAKGIGLVTAGGGHIRDYEGIDKSTVPMTPLIAINTTAGTASEMTRFCIITNTDTHVKMAIVDWRCTPLIAIDDPKLMIAKPASLTAATGMDALTHAIEGYITKAHNDMSDMFHMKAIKMIFKYLPAAVNEKNPEAIEKMGMAQYIAGMGFSNVGLGIVHSMAHQLGAVYDTPHGIANAMLLPIVMRFNGEVCADRFREILVNIGRPDAEHLNDQDVINTFVWMISELSKSVGITTTIKDYGAKEEDFEMLADKAMNDPCKPGNPREVSKEEFIELYRKAM